MNTCEKRSEKINVRVKEIGKCFIGVSKLKNTCFTVRLFYKSKNISTYVFENIQGLFQNSNRRGNLYHLQSEK